MAISVGGVRVQPMQGSPRVDLDPAKFETVLQEKGYRALWSKVAVCPHRNPADTNSHNPAHTDCDQGFVYYEPTEIRVLMTGIRMEQRYDRPGRFDMGVAYATFKAVHRLSYWDKLELQESSVRFMQIVTRGAPGTSDRLKYTATSLLRVEDSNRVYTLGADCVLDSTGKLAWSTGPQPSQGKVYSVSYEHKPVYVVLDLLHQIRDTRVATGTPQPFPHPPGLPDVFNRLPMQALVKLDFLVRDESKDE